MKFADCKIIVKSKKDRAEFLKACHHIHDFSVFFKSIKGIEVKDQWDRPKRNIRGLCGVSLNLEKYPFVNFLAHLWDCEDKKIRDEFIIVEDSKNGCK